MRRSRSESARVRAEERERGRRAVARELRPRVTRPPGGRRRCRQRGGEEPLRSQRGGDSEGVESEGREPVCGGRHEIEIDPPSIDREPSGERVGRGGGAAIPRRHARTGRGQLASWSQTDWQGRRRDQGRAGRADSLARFRYRCPKRSTWRRTSSTLRGSQASYEAMRGDVHRLRLESLVRVTPRVVLRSFPIPPQSWTPKSLPCSGSLFWHTFARRARRP